MVLAFCLFLGACGGSEQPPLVATDVVVTKPLPGNGMSAGYLSLTNNSDVSIRITAVASPNYGAIEIHESSLESGISKMRRIEVLDIPADSTVTLARGGKHLMLMRSRDTSENVSLNFYDDDTLLLTVSATAQTGLN